MIFKIIKKKKMKVLFFSVILFVVIHNLAK